MTTLFISHPACLKHLTPPGHPERPDRLRAIDRALEQENFALLAREQAPEASVASITLAHPEDHIRRIEDAVPEQGLVHIDADTVLSPGSWEAALRAAGGAVLAVDEVMTEKVQNAFVAARPPGHHAETKTAMGFCLFNNAVIAARHAQKQYGVERAAIIDWDVHHGNGTQEILWQDKTILYASTHEMPLYPGTGAANETGEHGQIVNAPLRAGDGSEEFRLAFKNIIIPKLKEHKPNLIVISAGFDAHWRDPLANLNLKEEDFAWATRELKDIAESSCEGRIVAVLEGGYDLEGLSRSVAAHIGALME